MTIRAIILGLLLGLGVSAATYFNDKVISQTMLVGNHLPISVFGIAVILILLVNPLLRLAGPKWPLRGGELAIIVALGLAACGWPGSGYFRGFDTITGLPAHWHKTKTAWQATGVMSYVPGAAAEVAPGQLTDDRALIETLRRGMEAPEGATTPEALLAAGLSDMSRSLVRQLAQAPSSIDPVEHDRLLGAINADLIAPLGDASLHHRLAVADLLPPEAQKHLARSEQLLGTATQLGDEVARLNADREEAPENERPPIEAKIARTQQEIGFLQREAEHAQRHANRAALAAVLPGVILPAPSGSGVLVASGRPDPFVVDTLLQGTGNSAPMGVTELPWRAWISPIRVWWSLALLLGVCAVCLAVIVHPQWSRRELLPYPIARFVEEAVERKEGAWLPEVAQQKAFWVGFIVLLVIHAINGLHAWFPNFIEVRLTFDFNQVRQLFPTASRVMHSNAYFQPRLFLSVIAFTFFLTTSVSFSLGIAQALFMMLGSILLLQGVSPDPDFAGSRGLTLMRFGAWAGVALVIGYTGRRYYGNVLTSALGMPRNPETPTYATWSARVLMLAALGSVLVLRAAGLDYLMGVLFVALSLLIFLVMSRIVCETGCFFIQPTWLPMGILTALFGFEAIGPTAFIVLAIASVLTVVDPRELLMPYLSNGLQIAERGADTRPARIAPWLTTMVIIGFFVAGTVTLYIQYRRGVAGMNDAWTTGSLPNMSFDKLALFLTEAEERGALTEAASVTPASRWSLISPIPHTYAWASLGLVLVVVTALARLWVPWWPLHPVAFLVWGTYPISQFTFSFLLGWIIKAAVVRLGGAKGYHAVKPLMIGVIAGELFAGLFWIAVGAVYFFVESKTPVRYSIFPG